MAHISIKKILIANRGEIACRIIKTCRILGILTVSIYTEHDRTSLHVSESDESVLIPGNSIEETYLNSKMIIEIAKSTGSDSIHPGYGFLSENFEFAKLCLESNITFIGPSPQSIHCMGSKTESKKILESILSKKYDDFHCKIIPGYYGENQDLDFLVSKCMEIGFPLIIKSSLGGGGKGMTILYEPDHLREEIESCKRISKAFFGSDHILIEKYYSNVKHIEIQIIGDHYGNIVHLFDRDCSVQRRHQKIIEEAPSILIDHDLREKISKSAVIIGNEINYISAGTIEFILDLNDLSFYFLEVNTRLQVEHPITEMITGVDIIEKQIKIAERYQLKEIQCQQSDIQINGHAIECRVYCENPYENFKPSSGQILWWKKPSELNARTDSFLKSGSIVSIFYDPMVAKIICFGKSRKEALRKMCASLGEMIIHGVVSNRDTLLQIITSEIYQKGYYNTRLLEREIDHQERIRYFSKEIEKFKNPFVISSFLFDWLLRNETRKLLKHVKSGFRNSIQSYQRQEWILDGETIKLQYKIIKNNSLNNTTKHDDETLFEIVIDDHVFQITLLTNQSIESIDINHPISPRGTITYLWNNKRIKVNICKEDDRFYSSNPLCHVTFKLIKKDRLISIKNNQELDSGVYKANMNCKIVKINVKEKSVVKKNDVLMILESMKMENKVLALNDGIVERIYTKEGELSYEGDILIEVKDQ